MMHQDEDTIGKWAAGEDAPWPPLPDLRFEVGARVECRVGPHPVRGWAPGEIVATFYKEPEWPPGMMAPYQIQLDDGRLIFAPQDVDEVIRAVITSEDVKESQKLKLIYQSINNA